MSKLHIDFAEWDSQGVPMFPEASTFSLRLRWLTALLDLLVALSASVLSSAQDTPFAVLIDDGTLTHSGPGGLVLDLRAVARKFYETYADNADFMAVFTDFDLQEFGAACYRVKNDVRGIGYALFDNTAHYGSSGRLQCVLMMNRLAGTGVNLIAHECGHRWIAYVRHLDAESKVSSALLTTYPPPVHWTQNMVTAGWDLMGGRPWLDNGDGTFTMDESADRSGRDFSNLDLYLMGLIEPAGVGPILYIKADHEAGGTETTIAGSLVEVSVEDIIAVEGPRLPGVSDSQKDFNMALVLVTQHGASDAELDALETITTLWPERWKQITRGLATTTCKVSRSLLRWDPISETKNGNPGQTVEFLPILWNNQDVADTFFLQWSVDGSWPVTVTPEGPISLLPHESTTVQVRLSIPPNAVTGEQTTVTLTATSLGAGASASTVLTARSLNPFTYKLGDLVWYDTDQDGIQDQDEPGVGGVGVSLYDNGDCAGDPVRTLFTGEAGPGGKYLFVGLGLGTYSLLFSNIPPGWLISPRDQGRDDRLDSDADPLTGEIRMIRLFGDDASRDVGLYRPGSISGRVWTDFDGAGVYDAGEGLNSITVWLYGDPDGGGIPNVLLRTTESTDGEGDGGWYSFEGLITGPPGGPPVYYLVSVDSADPDLGNYNQLITPGAFSESLSSDSPSKTGGNFGFARPRVSLGGMVWYDINQDGIQDEEEPGIKGIEVSLYQTGDCSGDPMNVTLTGVDGKYVFAGLACGTYSLQFADIPVGWVVSPKDQGGDDTLDSDAEQATRQVRDIPLSEDDFSQDMGVFRPGSISGRVWTDFDGALQYDSGEGLDGIAVYLYSDPNGDGDQGDGTLLLTTETCTEEGAAGYYGFQGLNTCPPGASDMVHYVVQIDAADDDLLGWTAPITPTRYAATLTADSWEYLGADFGFQSPSGDGDGDGVADACDAFPRDPTEWLDTDGDGTGDNADPDDDNDGMPDSWENQWGLDPKANDANQDNDGDGQANYAEYVAGTTPTDPGSVFAVTELIVEAGESTLTWSSVPGKVYRVWHSYDLAMWSLLSDAVPASEGKSTDWSCPGSPGESKGYYKIEVLP